MISLINCNPFVHAQTAATLFHDGFHIKKLKKKLEVQLIVRDSRGKKKKLVRKKKNHPPKGDCGIFYLFVSY